ncbi:ATP-binding protein [bacterium]|nr:ATP-binding protein [bacterium]
MNNRLILIRGLPGSGKSTMAKQIMNSAPNPDSFRHYEADMYFIDSDGVYRFNPRLLSAAHSWCQNSTEKALRAGHNVIVSNTFTQAREIEPYLSLAKKIGGIKVEIKTATGNYKNVHDVPEAAIQRMRDRWEEFP